MHKLKLIFQDKDLRKKIIFALAMLTVFRIGAAIPIPGIDAGRLRAFFADSQFFGLLNIVSGGSLDKLSVMMLGVAPYITSSIIMQLLTMIFPPLKELYHEEGEIGRQKFNQYSRVLTIPLAALQAFGLLTLLERQGILTYVSPFGKIASIIIVTAGSVFLMWLGELISERGIGNGVSLIIFAGIVSGIPVALGRVLLSFNASQIPVLLVVAALAFFVVAGVVIITEGERPVPISYAKRVRGMKMYGGISTYLPLRVNQAGVIPIIFAISILLFPQMIMNVLSLTNISFFKTASSYILEFLNNSWVYGFSYFILVFLFTYFYTAVTFDSDAISSNLQKSGAFIPGVRPGPSTSAFLYKIINKITLTGAMFLGVIATLPLIVQAITGLSALTIGGTALLIVVSVILETIKQIEAQISMREYE